MTEAHLARLWIVVGLFLVFYSLNTWIVSQGGKALFGVELLDDQPVTSALVAIPICAVLLVLQCRIGMAYADRSGMRRQWHARTPVVGLDGLKTGSREGKLYQAFFLILFVIVPVAALGYFVDQVLGGTVYDRVAKTEHSPLAAVDWATIASASYWDDRFRLGEGPDKAVTWFPVVEPVLLGLLLLLAAAHVVLLAVRLFGR